MEQHAATRSSVDAPAPEGYDKLRHKAAWADLPGRAVITLSGRDAVSFLDHFTTAAVAGRDVGQGT